MTVAANDAQDAPPTVREVAVATPLEYEPPQRVRPAWKRDLVLGIVAVLCLALGTGFASFGFLMASWNYREAEASLIAVGFSLLVLGVGFVALILWLRRSYR